MSKMVRCCMKYYYKYSSSHKEPCAFLKSIFLECNLQKKNDQEMAYGEKLSNHWRTNMEPLPLSVRGGRRNSMLLK